MKILILILILLSTSFSNVIHLTTGVYINGVHTQKYLALSIKVMEKYFKDHNIDANTIIYTNEKDILNDFKNNKIKVIVSHPFFYFKYENELDKIINDKWFLRVNNKDVQTYYLISQKNEKNVFSNLEKYNLYALGKSDNSIYWLTNKYNKKFKKSFLPILNKIKLSSKEKKILYNVFFSKENVGLITKAFYDVIVEINPQIKNKIRIVKKSKAIFIGTIGLNNKSINKNEKRTLEKILNGVKTFLGDSPLAESRKLMIINDFKNNELNKFKAFKIDYDRLNKKYNK